MAAPAESPSLRTGSSQDASHKTGLPIEALDINRDRTHAILAGKEILKTVRVQQQDARIVEETNLRAAVINYSDHAHARQRNGLGIQDVKWSHGQFNTHIATAAANGKVILYDLNRAGVELARLHEHTRQVHKLAFNPHQGHLLLSASHDGTVRLWDLRDTRKEIMTCRSRDQYAGLNGAIYDIQWSPTDAVEFAFGTDNGTIMRWDYSNNRVAKQKITAHEQKPCTAIDWHPDGKHLLSAGLDRTVKVWDFSIGVRRQKPTLTLHTPYPVHNARWRPPNWSEEGAYQCTQLATAYDRDHSTIHLWDFRRPHLPFREINKFSSAPSDMLWHSRDTLWTVGREGVFQQNDVHHAPRTLDRRNLQAIAVSSSGEIGGIAQRRPRRRRSTGLAYSEDTYAAGSREKRSSPEKSSLRSSGENSFDENFLLTRRHHGRTASNRSAKSFGSTPPSDAAPKVMFLTDSMVVQNETSRPNQLALRGTLPGTTNIQIFAYLAQKYRAIPLTDPPTVQSFEDVQHIFEKNAEYAQRAACYRLATTWRFVGFTVASNLQRRAQLHRNRRRVRTKPTTLASLGFQPEPLSEKLKAHDKQKSHSDLATAAPVNLVQTTSPSHSTDQNIATTESTSNIATPLARPLTGIPVTANEKQRSPLPDIDRDEKIELPPAIAGPHSNNGLLAPDSASRQADRAANRPRFNGPQWYHSTNDLDERRAMVGSWRAPPRVPLSFEPPESRGLNIQVPPRLDRHDSDESFAMFSASTDSQHGSSMPGSLNSGTSHPQNVDAGSHEPLRPFDESSFGKLMPSAIGADHREQLHQSIQISPTTIPKIDGSTTASHDRDKLGTACDDASPPPDNVSQEQAMHDFENLHRNNQLLRHDSSESEAFTSSGSGVSVSSLMGYSLDMEASGTIVPDGHDPTRSPQGLNPPVILPHATESAAPALDPASEDRLLLEDFQAMHVDAEEEQPFAMIGLLENLLKFFTDSQADAQTSSLILLLLTPLLPQARGDPGQSDIDLKSTLAAYTETFTALGLSPTQSETILSTEMRKIIATGINPYQAEAILHTYHSQLHSLSLYNAAATVRRLAYPTYPAVYEQALKGTQIGLLCLSCKSPINNPKDKMRCETCKRAQAPCPICWGRYPAFEAVTTKNKAKAKLRMSSLRDTDHKRKRSSLLSSVAADVDEDYDHPSASVPEPVALPNTMLWTWCPICGHGGHTHCLSTWFSDARISDGACATEGCLCDCVQGKSREEKVHQILRLKAEKERSRVVRKGDDWKVGESKAVSAVRGALDDTALGTVQNTDSSTGAQFPRTKEDGRRVRVVEPHIDHD
ncbi:SEA (Seh1-associated) complex subunit [Didymosphaeria variabile]|uniref:SEA (Seh1-associated) complex subunit n=1 Tax=Didymosphaeria variabile TaxID=1932322 RepID=A0A9W9CAK7_9PLEO|nr:SEA (Seh1-associated) complex subunit [Didymosphaeria variabile]KAJ4351851.1 SEA (Seh1-associated) complex subunit [Didymosphaeria variabile]